MIQLEIDDECVLGAVVVLPVDVVEGSEDGGDGVDGPAVEKQIVVVFLEEPVFFGTAALDLVQHVPFVFGAADIEQTLCDPLIQLPDPLQPPATVESLLRSRLNYHFLPPFAAIYQHKLYLGVNEAVLFDEIVGLAQELAAFAAQLDLPHRQPLEDVADGHLGPRVARTLPVRQLEVELPVAKTLLLALEVG